MLEFIKAHYRQFIYVVLAILAYLFMPTDLIWSFCWAIVGLLIMKQFITIFDRYWSRNAKRISLSLFMQSANGTERAIIYASIIVGMSFIIGSAIGL